MTIDEARDAMRAAVDRIREMDDSRATCCPTWSPTAIRDAAAAFAAAADAWYAQAVDAEAPESDWAQVANWDFAVQLQARAAYWAELDADAYGMMNF